jgi:hypothetical protein
LTPHVSDSADQRAAELVAIEALSLLPEVGKLVPSQLELVPGVFVHVDGYSVGPPVVLAEVFANQGPLKGGQRHKLMSDALKLVAVSRRLFEGKAKGMLVLTDEVAADSLRRGWRGEALQALGVEVRTVAIPEELAARVRQAQLRQRMTNPEGKP